MGVDPMNSGYDLVEVEWLDAVEIHDWREPGTVPNTPVRTFSVGYLVSETKEALSIISLINENHMSMGVVIPMGMVENVQYLSRRRK